MLLNNKNYVLIIYCIDFTIHLFYDIISIVKFGGGANMCIDSFETTDLIKKLNSYNKKLCIMAAESDSETLQNRIIIIDYIARRYGILGACDTISHIINNVKSSKIDEILHAYIIAIDKLSMFKHKYIMQTFCNRIDEVINSCSQDDLKLIHDKYGIDYFNESKKYLKNIYRYCIVFDAFLTDYERDTLVQLLNDENNYKFIYILSDYITFNDKQKELLQSYITLYELSDNN